MRKSLDESEQKQFFNVFIDDAFFIIEYEVVASDYTLAVIIVDCAPIYTAVAPAIE